MWKHHGGLEELEGNEEWGSWGGGSNMYLISPYMGPEVAPRRAEYWIVQTQWLDDERKVIYELREERRGGNDVVDDQLSGKMCVMLARWCHWWASSTPVTCRP